MERVLRGRERGGREREKERENIAIKTVEREIEGEREGDRAGGQPRELTARVVNREGEVATRNLNLHRRRERGREGDILASDAIADQALSLLPDAGGTVPPQGRGTAVEGGRVLERGRRRRREVHSQASGLAIETVQTLIPPLMRRRRKRDEVERGRLNKIKTCLGSINFCLFLSKHGRSATHTYHRHTHTLCSCVEFHDFLQ